jgi:tetratricopeptide (TPR) repeat protein
MTPERWQRIKAALEEVDAAAESKRESVLERLCAGDADLRREVEPFLNDVGEGTFIRDAIGPKSARIAYAASGHDRFGRYQLIRRIGQGGMGAVFEAVRVDDFHKKVAIKIIKQGLDSDFARLRFLQERQLLAALEHPYIARLLDGGESEDGSPYLALEFGDGEPITQYGARLDRTGRLRLFLKVCEAVEHAHRNLVVHRDLKPANILVTSSGDPKLLDFGIAKLLDPEATRTQTGFAALTPEYASPEQVRGEPITTASDVYSLGVVLYELLTGRKPYRLETLTAIEMDRVICRQPPAPPELGDELDHILLMALRKEPERRYGGADHLARDIERYLDHRPVSARPDTIRYRAKKFVRRNWWQMATITLVTLSLSAGLGFSLAAQARANRRFNQVRQLANRFLFDFHDEIVNTPGTVKARGMIVATALEYLNSLAGDAAGDPGLQWELAGAYAKVATAQGSTTSPSLGQSREAAASYEKAIALARPLAARNWLNTAQRTAFVRILRDAEVTIRTLPDYDRALRFGREAVARSAGLPAIEGTNALLELAYTMGRSGDLTACVGIWKQVLPRRRDAVRAEASVRNLSLLSQALVSLGYFEAKITQFDDALADGAEGLAIISKLQADHPESHFGSPLFLALYDLGLTEGAGERPSMGNAKGAMQHYQEALSVVGKLIAADPHDNQSRTNAGLLYTQMEITVSESSPREALGYAAAAETALDAAAAGDARFRTIPRIWAASAYRELGLFVDAEAALKLAEKIQGTNRDNEGDLQLMWARLEVSRKNMPAAAQRFDRAIAAYEKELEPPTPGAAWALAEALNYAATAFPALARPRKERIFALWEDQDRRYPGHPYLRNKAAAALAALDAH